LTGATNAGDILQPAPPPNPAGMTRPTTANITTEMLVTIVQNLLLLR
jgi:hypothetical protein